MINKEIRERLNEEEQMLMFDNPAYDNSIVGISTDGRLIYDYDKMAQEIMQDDGMNEEESYDFVSYNTLRALDYTADEKKPIVMYRMEQDENG